MQENKHLTDRHLCFVVFNEMTPEDFLDFFYTNTGLKNMSYLHPEQNFELYFEAKEQMKEKQNRFGVELQFDFIFQDEPFSFNKLIEGNLDRKYKICIFEAGVGIS